MTDPIELVQRVLREEDLERAVCKAAAARDAWVHEQLHRRWPLLAEVPERTQRLLSAVACLLASTTQLEAEGAAARLGQEASALATLRPSYAKVVTSLTVLAPCELRFPAAEDPRRS